MMNILKIKLPILKGYKRGKHYKAISYYKLPRKRV